MRTIFDLTKQELEELCSILDLGKDQYANRLNEMLNGKLPEEEEIKEEPVHNVYKVKGTYTFETKEVAINEEEAIDFYMESLYESVRYPSNVLEDIKIEIEYLQVAEKDEDGDYLDYNEDEE